jgi:hypothetical protein
MLKKLLLLIILNLNIIFGNGVFIRDIGVYSQGNNKYEAGFFAVQGGILRAFHLLLSKYNIQDANFNTTSYQDIDHIINNVKIFNTKITNDTDFEGFITVEFDYYKFITYIKKTISSNYASKICNYYLVPHVKRGKNTYYTETEKLVSDFYDVYSDLLKKLKIKTVPKSNYAQIIDKMTIKDNQYEIFFKEISSSMCHRLIIIRGEYFINDLGDLDLVINLDFYKNNESEEFTSVQTSKNENPIIADLVQKELLTAVVLYEKNINNSVENEYAATKYSESFNLYSVNLVNSNSPLIKKENKVQFIVEDYEGTSWPVIYQSLLSIPEGIRVNIESDRGSVVTINITSSLAMQELTYALLKANLSFKNYKNKNYLFIYKLGM